MTLPRHDPNQAVERSALTVFVLLPVYNRRELTPKFINCLVTQTDPRVQLIVFDDGSSDGTAQTARENVPRVIVLKGNGNWWRSSSMQPGYEWLSRRAPTDLHGVLPEGDDMWAHAEAEKK